MDALAHALVVSVILFGSDQTANLIAIGGLLIGATPIILGLLVYRRKTPPADAGLADDARARIANLIADRDDLARQLQECRTRRQVLDAEAKVKDMEIGALQARYVEKCRELERCQEMNDAPRT